MNKICILTEGGSAIGLGHISRCLSLYQAFVANNQSAQLIVRGDNSILNALERTNYIQFDWIKEHVQVLKIVENADIIIIDSYYCSSDLYMQLAQVSATTAYIDDNVRMEYPDGVVINGVMCAERMNYTMRSGMKYLLGHEYSFLRKEFWDVPDKTIGTDVKSVLITCGSNDREGLSYRILKSIVKIYPSLEKTVILGNKQTPYLQYYLENANVLSNQSAGEMKTVMLNADIVITASGQTTYELCRTGTPFIAITTAENQLFSINCFYEKGLINQPISSSDDDLESKILNQFNCLLPYSTRESISEKMKQTINGKGSIKVAKFLLSIT